MTSKICTKKMTQLSWYAHLCGQSRHMTRYSHYVFHRSTVVATLMEQWQHAMAASHVRANHRQGESKRKMGVRRTRFRIVSGTHFNFASKFQLTTSNVRYKTNNSVFLYWVYLVLYLPCFVVILLKKKVCE